MRRPREDDFLEAFDAYADALFRHATLRLSDRERARDLTQDTFVKAWDYIASGQSVQAWRGFLYRIMNNLIIDEYRRRGKDLSLDALLEDERGSAEALLTQDGRRETEEALDIARATSLVRPLIDELPEPYRGALLLRYVDGLSPKEVAEALGISENAVGVRIHRAVARLKTLCAAHDIYL